MVQPHSSMMAIIRHHDFRPVPAAGVIVHSEKFFMTNNVLQWLMEGDAAIRYQVSRDILHLPFAKLPGLQRKIANEGWGKLFLSKQQANGHWGITFYQPKWTSTHYTVLDLKIIGLPPDNKQARKSVDMVLTQPAGINGGINMAVSLAYSDVCVNGMILNYGSYFSPAHRRLKDVVDFLLEVQMPDGGWNCSYRNKQTVHSSLHSTLSVLEGMLEFRRSSGAYRSAEIRAAEKRALEFLLIHKLYQSHRTGSVIDERMLRLSFPGRWRYDILRCLDHLRGAGVAYDKRMENALNILRQRRDKDGKWPLQEKHKGAVHFHMEKTGAPSRWNTLRAMRVLNHFDKK